MRNKHPGFCYLCKRFIEKGAGHFERDREKGAWRVVHGHCIAARQEAARGDRRGSLAAEGWKKI